MDRSMAERVGWCSPFFQPLCYCSGAARHDAAMG